ncbi:hypothetical protein RclHR1_07380001 [Rhizophagus clarus]|uniref:Uncharacterized protein n=1 Tax=Rhizophagus clarus TaxID=94130 RepID=A0A2Z6RYH0_9GLOM|nr:hypothetical protein RclHR1_07380001 [Rhizophagus clarus]
MVKMLHKCLPIDCRGYNEAWNSIHDKLTIEFKLIGQKELKNDKTMPTRLNSAITELLGRQANSAKFREFVKLSMEVKCDRLCCPNHKRRGSQAATVQLSVTITQQNERRASILLQRGQPEIDYDGNGANVECYDDPFITLPVSPPLHTRLEWLIKAVLLTIDAIRKYIAIYIQEPWVDIDK